MTPEDLALFDAAGIAVAECRDCGKPVPVVYLSPGYEEPVSCGGCARRRVDAEARAKLPARRFPRLELAVWIFVCLLVAGVAGYLGSR